MATKTTVFKSNQTQAVRLPRAVAFPEHVKEVEIVVIGSARIIAPVGHRWDAYFARGTKLSDDFQRADQGGFETRERL